MKFFAIYLKLFISSKCTWIQTSSIRRYWIISHSRTYKLLNVVCFKAKNIVRCIRSINYCHLQVSNIKFSFLTYVGIRECGPITNIAYQSIWWWSPGSCTCTSHAPPISSANNVVWTMFWNLWDTRYNDIIYIGMRPCT